MMKALLVISLMISQAFASEYIFGQYIGKDEQGDACTLAIYPHDEVAEVSIGFKNKVYNKTYYEFTSNLNDFIDSLQNGSAKFSNNDEGSWSYVYMEELFIDLQDDLIKQVRVRIQDDRWWRRRQMVESTCLELEKVKAFNE